MNDTLEQVNIGKITRNQDQLLPPFKTSLGGTTDMTQPFKKMP